MRCAYPTRKAKGFTLLELLIALSIISILALFAVPSYVRYVNEAKAADFLTRIHQIALAYHEVLLVDVPNQKDLRPYDSPSMGEPPKKFDDLSTLYAEHYGIELGSFLVNHSNYFGTISDGEIPVLFLKANTDAGRDVLHALDHVTQNQHSFANPSLMIIALEDSVQRQSTTAASSGNPPGEAKPKDPKPSDANPVVNPSVDPNPVVNPTGPNTVAEVVTGPTPGTDTVASTGTDKVTEPTTNDQHGTDTGSAGGGTAGGAGGVGAQPSTSGSAGSSTTVSQLNWPPGWAKHPEQHQGDVFPGQGHHGNH